MILDNPRHIAERARRNGRDVIEALDVSGVLLTKEREHRIIMEALNELRRDMSQWSASEYLRRVNKTTSPTPRNMYDAIMGYLNDYIEHQSSNR